MKLLLILGLFISYRAFAAYKCQVSLVKAGGDEVLSSREVAASDTDLRSVVIKDFYLEPSEEKSRLDLKVFIDGWPGEEEASFSVLRKSPVLREELGEKMSLRSDAKDTLWLDSYRLEADCSVN